MCATDSYSKLVRTRSVKTPSLSQLCRFLVTETDQVINFDL